MVGVIIDCVKKFRIISKFEDVAVEVIVQVIYEYDE
jgi:hypothetical protein